MVSLSVSIPSNSVLDSLDSEADALCFCLSCSASRLLLPSLFWTMCSSPRLIRRRFKRTFLARSAGRSYWACNSGTSMKVEPPKSAELTSLKFSSASVGFRRPMDTLPIFTFRPVCSRICLSASAFAMGSRNNTNSTTSRTRTRTSRKSHLKSFFMLGFTTRITPPTTANWQLEQPTSNSEPNLQRREIRARRSLAPPDSWVAPFRFCPRIGAMNRPLTRPPATLSPHWGRGKG